MNNLTLIQFQHDPFITPLGALYLASGLEKENIQFDLKLYPLYKYHSNLDKLYSFFAETSEIIAIGCWSDMLPYVLVTLGKIKKNFPEKIIILGGVGPTEVAKEILDKFKFIDFIIKGCGVYSLPKLIKNIKNDINAHPAIEGLVYRDNNKVISNFFTGYHFNIPDVPLYQRLENIQLYRSFSIFTSFGCPYKCTYCDTRPVSPRKVVYRNLNKVIEEIKFIKRIRKNKKFTLEIFDEAFVINRKRVIRFCNLLKAEKLNIPWTCFGRIDRVDGALLRIMKKSNCKGIYYGIESGSNGILKKIKKGFRIEKAIKILLLSKKYIKDITASFIYLFPFEKPKDFMETKFFLRYLRLKKIFTQLHVLCPVKNSGIYLKYKNKLFLSTKIRSSSHLELNALPPECVKLVKNYPEIFYFYYFYNFKELNEVLRIAKGCR